MLGGISLFAKRIESMENIRSIVTNEVAKYIKRGVNIDVNYIDGPVIHVTGQIPLSNGKVKVTETLYLGSSSDGAEEHPPVMTQQEYGSLRIIGQIIVVHVYEGVLLSREYVIHIGDELKVSDDVIKVIIVGKGYVKLKDAVENVKQQGTQQARPTTQQPYYTI